MKHEVCVSRKMKERGKGIKLGMSLQFVDQKCWRTLSIMKLCPLSLFLSLSNVSHVPKIVMLSFTLMIQTDCMCRCSIHTTIHMTKLYV